MFSYYVQLAILINLTGSNHFIAMALADILNEHGLSNKCKH